MGSFTVPGLELLRHTPDIVTWIVASLDEADARWKPAPDRWCVLEDLDRAGLHGDLGPITLGNLLYEWPLHDLGHVRQVAELVRARKYHPHIGAWREMYPMQP